MSPSYALAYICYCWCFYVKQLRQISKIAFSRGINLSNFLNLCLSQFRPTILHPKYMNISFFGNHVSHIVGMRPKKKVVKAKARSNVTRMAHKQLVWDRSISQFPSNPMDFLSFPIQHKRPVPRFLFTPCPKPALSRFIYFAPESFFQCWARFKSCAQQIASYTFTRALNVAKTLFCTFPFMLPWAKVPQSVFSRVKIIHVTSYLNVGCHTQSDRESLLGILLFYYQTLTEYRL